MRLPILLAELILAMAIQGAHCGNGLANMGKGERFWSELCQEVGGALEEIHQAYIPKSLHIKNGYKIILETLSLVTALTIQAVANFTEKDLRRLKEL